MAVFTISPCNPADVDGMVTVHLEAFSSNYLTRILFPPSAVSRADQAQWTRKRVLDLLSKPELRHFKITDETSGGKLVAWARWSYPTSFSEEELAAREAEKKRKAMERLDGNHPSEWPEGANVLACEGKFGGLDAMREKYVKVDDMYMLGYLATLPEYQRKGLAKMLLDPSLALADAEERKTYLEATEAGYPVYLKRGFRDVDIISVDLSQWGATEPGVNRVMIRDPQPSS